MELLDHKIIRSYVSLIFQRNVISVIILKILDSLTPLDQMLLKCASVLGEIVNRNMLQFLMDADPSVTKEIGIGKKYLLIHKYKHKS